MNIKPFLWSIAAAPKGVTIDRIVGLGIVIRSLYGKTKRPEVSWVKSVDYVVYDIQDVGITNDLARNW